MAAPLSQKEYLKKYLGGTDDKKKKKKKKKDKLPPHSKGMRIVEDSLDIKNVPFGYSVEDDDPTVAEITYDDEKMKAMEEFAENKKWKKVQDRDGKDDDGSDWLQVHRHCSNSNSPPQRTRRGSHSPPRRTKRDSISPPKNPRKGYVSPPRKLRHDSGSPPKRMRHDSGSSPRRMRHDSGSPPRRMRHDSGSPPRKGKEDSWSSQQQKGRHDSTTSPQSKFASKTQIKKPNESHNPAQPVGQGGRVKMSPPKRFRHDSRSPSIRRQRHDSASPHERLRRGSNSPQPGRKRHDSSTLSQGHSNDQSPRKRLDSDMSNLQLSRRHDSDNSASPSPRRHDSVTSLSRKNNKEFQISTQKRKQEVKVTQTRKPAPDTRVSPMRRKRNDSDLGDSDASPPRKNERDSEVSPIRRGRHDSDLSPTKRKRFSSDSSPPRRRRNDSNASPPRRKRHDSDSSPVRNKGHDTDVSPPRRFEDPQKGQRMERKMTTREFLTARKRGKLKKDTPEELARKQREAVLQRNAEEKHQQWKHGVKQIQDYKQKLADDAHEMGKAFSRTADDVDMNKQLKVVARKEDPMLEYVMKKESKSNNQSVKPLFKGAFPPNRLDIRPGYRWDGVDRSSGFEKRWFEHQNNKRAYAEDAYKWSVSDM